MALVATQCTLLLVDLQTRLMPAITGGDQVVANAGRLLEGARLVDVPIRATEQNPAGIGPMVEALAQPAASTLTKTYFDATREAAFASFLPETRDTIVVAGCEAHVCVLQTVLGLRSQGRQVVLVRDAVGSRAVENRDAALERAREHGAELVTTEMVLFEWLATSDHSGFRDVLRLVK